MNTKTKDELLKLTINKLGIVGGIEAFQKAQELAEKLNIPLEDIASKIQMEVWFGLNVDPINAVYEIAKSIASEELPIMQEVEITQKENIPVFQATSFVKERIKSEYIFFFKNKKPSKSTLFIIKQLNINLEDTE